MLVQAKYATGEKLGQRQSLRAWGNTTRYKQESISEGHCEGRASVFGERSYHKAKAKRVLRRLVQSANAGSWSNKDQNVPIKFDNIKVLLTTLSVRVRMEATLLMTKDSNGKKVKLTGIDTCLRCLQKK